MEICLKVGNYAENIILFNKNDIKQPQVKANVQNVKF